MPDVPVPGKWASLVNRFPCKIWSVSHSEPPSRWVRVTARSSYLARPPPRWGPGRLAIELPPPFIHDYNTLVNFPSQSSSNWPLIESVASRSLHLRFLPLPFPCPLPKDLKRGDGSVEALVFRPYPIRHCMPIAFMDSLPRNRTYAIVPTTTTVTGVAHRGCAPQLQ
jgi:hypothetical protein